MITCACAWELGFARIEHIQGRCTEEEEHTESRRALSWRHAEWQLAVFLNPDNIDAADLYSQYSKKILSCLRSAETKVSAL